MEKQKFSKKAPKYTETILTKVFDKTDGKCHLCGKTLVFKNYGVKGARGEWQVEHSKSIEQGGTDHLNNLYSSCPVCNPEKGGKKTAAEMRVKKGIERLPNSKTENVKLKEQNKTERTKEGAVLGGVIGSAVAGPLGAFVGSFLGAELGKHLADDTKDKKVSTKAKSKKKQEESIFSLKFK
jgi:hypothetical protein